MLSRGSFPDVTSKAEISDMFSKVSPSECLHTEEWFLRHLQPISKQALSDTHAAEGSNGVTAGVT